jgi:serine protease Do
MRSHLIPFLIQATLAFSGLALIPHSAFAQEQSEAGRDQINLVWVSGYQGPLSGRMGPRAREAVVRFQDALGTTRTGVLTEYERDELENQAVAEKRRLGWQMRLDPATGMRIGIPETFLSGVTRKDSGTEYKGVRGSFLLQTMVKELSVAAGMREHMELVLDALRAQGFASTYMTLKDDWFVVNASHTSKRTDVYVRVHLVGRWVKGYLLFTPQNGAPIGAMVPAVSLSLQPDADEPLYRPPAPPSVVERYPTPMPAAVAPAAVKPTDPPVVVPPSKSGTGSGFIVAAGKILTNNHVVDGCTSVSVANVGGATVLALDVKNDLALIGAPSVSGPPLAMAVEPARLGEDVVAMGYPLGSLLGNRLNITQGIVSSTEGLRGDWTNLQIAVPVQPGNSGGPLLDLEGRVRGVVVSKLNPRVLAGGDIMLPEQVNFAIKGEVARGFLKGNGVVLVETTSQGKDGRKSTADIAESAKASVVQVVCK